MINEHGYIGDGLPRAACLGTGLNGAKLSDASDHNHNRNRNPFSIRRLRSRLGLGLRLAVAP
jgi:hypothetical protein